jgi:hypothetical protein
MRSIWKDLDLSEPLWRYVKTERFRWMLENSRLFFASANQFTDPFEGAVAIVPPEYKVDPRYAERSGSEKAFFELKRLTKISCWHRASFESHLMWRLYAEESKGVAICSTPERIRAGCQPFRLAPNYGSEDLWAGNVRYMDLLKERLNIGMLERFFVKHLAFAPENEFRLAISLRTAEEFAVKVPELGIEVVVDLDALIEKVVLGPDLALEARQNLAAVVHAAGLGKKLATSGMLGTPRYT